MTGPTVNEEPNEANVVRLVTLIQKGLVERLADKPEPKDTLDSELGRRLLLSHNFLQVTCARFSQLLSLFEALRVKHLDTEALAQIGEMLCATEMDSLDDFNNRTQALLDALPS